MKFALYVALLALQFLDFATTVYALKHGARERNVYLAALFARIGVERGLLGAKTVAVLLLAVGYPFIPWPMFLGLTAVYVYVVWRNVLVVQRQRANR